MKIKTIHILAKVFYPITIIATNIEVKNRLRKKYPSFIHLVFDEGVNDRMGYCVDFWILKKKILKERYNIDWKTPMEEYPGTRYG